MYVSINELVTFHSQYVNSYIRAISVSSWSQGGESIYQYRRNVDVDRCRSTSIYLPGGHVGHLSIYLTVGYVGEM
jgi:hypothetical protein